MNNTFGRQVTVTLFGESHGAAIGAVLDGIAAGIPIDFDSIRSALTRRRGEAKLSTARREADPFQIVSGVKDGVTCGTPICILIPNGDTKSGDYQSGICRPSHADYTAHVKYGGFEDYRGGGHFSGRITAALVAAGDIARQILKKHGIQVCSHLLQVGQVRDLPFAVSEEDILNQMHQKGVLALSAEAEQAMRQEIESARSAGDSVGGIIQTAVLGVPAGVGEPWFDSLEGVLAHMLFSIPGVKGVSFGGGFDMCTRRGSQVNDSLYYKETTVKTASNFSGGINGGIANGMPLIFETAVKPTPSISLPQQTVDVIQRQTITAKTAGRHDPAIVHRAMEVADSAAALCVLDLICVRSGTLWQTNN